MQGNDKTPEIEPYLIRSGARSQASFKIADD
jgi:hypothetical protein